MSWRRVPRKRAIALVSTLALGAVAAVSLLPSIPQDPGYHAFADARTLLGIPHFWNVATSLPFSLVGLLGLRYCASPAAREASPLWSASVAFFAGALALGFGSAYYHLQPSNDTLLWDRLPMTMAFMAFFSAVISATVSPVLGRYLLWPLLAAGVASVVYWYATETAGQGDLRPYGLVQFLPLLLTPVLLVLSSSDLPGRGYWWAVLGFYCLAKLAELADGWLYAAMGFSGHALKHVLAAAGLYGYLLALQRNGAESSRDGGGRFG